MWSVCLWLLAASSSALAASRRNYDDHDYYAVHLRSGITPQDVSSHLGLHFEGQLGELEDHYIFRDAQKQDDYDHISTALAELKLKRRKREIGWDEPHPLDHVLLSKKQDLRTRFPLVKRQAPPRPALNTGSDDATQLMAAVERGNQIAARLGIADPIYGEQWHLYNPVQPGHDLNITGVWEQGITGNGSIVCIVDDGLDLDSEDLRENYYRPGSWDFNDQTQDPKPRLSDDHHGTRCAGEIGAVRNNICGVGVAYGGKISGLRILSKVISDADEAEAMTYHMQENQIYSCSWGPPDDGQSMEAPDVLIQRSMVTAVQKGRGGKGVIYVFAIGNGAANDDNCNFDGYTNSIYSVSVGSIDRTGKHPYYSEACSAQLVVTYSSGSGDAIHTTDVGLDKCTTTHGGTSAAGPLVAGIFALMLEVNPALTWRDMQYITALTAVKIDQPAEWQMNNAVGKEFSHQFGYGKADAYAMVEAAKNWTNVKPQAWYFSPWMHINHAVPQGAQGLASSFEVTSDMLHEANVERLEHVTVTMTVEHTRRGDLSVELRSPSGMVSHLATARRNDAANAGYDDWTFMSVAHWGESGVGTWTVIVKDTKENGHTGTFIDWRLKLFGEARDGTNQPLLPLPTEHDDDGRKEVHRPGVSTTSVAVPTETGVPDGNPDGHIDRPTVNKPTAPAAPPQPTPPSTTKPEGDKEEELASEPSSTPTSSNFLPHPFPSFGVSKKTQIWIYGAMVLILVFLIALGAWAWYIRRKQKKWMSRDAYGFEIVNNDEDDDGRGASSGAAGGRRKKNRRAGELYDAFAEGTDEEAEMFELGSDSEVEPEEEKTRRERYEEGGDVDERYRDHEPHKEGTDVS